MALHFAALEAGWSGATGGREGPTQTCHAATQSTEVESRSAVDPGLTASAGWPGANSREHAPPEDRSYAVLGRVSGTGSVGGLPQAEGFHRMGRKASCSGSPGSQGSAPVRSRDGSDSARKRCVRPGPRQPIDFLPHQIGRLARDAHLRLTLGPKFSRDALRVPEQPSAVGEACLCRRA
jgi:hypothetical protein